MSVFFSGKELLETAIGIERNGVAFYDSLASSARNETVKHLYQHLADEERRHIEVFTNMLSSVADYRSPESYTEEYANYLRALTGSAVFTDDQSARDLAQRVTSDAQAIKIGMQAEKDSILFYSEMRDLVRRSDREVIAKIIEEERAHLKRLLDLDASLGSQRR